MPVESTALSIPEKAPPGYEGNDESSPINEIVTQKPVTTEFGGTLLTYDPISYPHSGTFNYGRNSGQVTCQFCRKQVTGGYDNWNHSIKDYRVHLIECFQILLTPLYYSN